MELPANGSTLNVPYSTEPPSSDPASSTTATDVEAGKPSENPNHAVKEVEKWPGWPGDSVYRLIVPVVKVGSIIGRKGELIKKMCEETRARIRILEGPVGTTDRIVLISGKEEVDAAMSPAMEGVIRVFKRVSGVFEHEADGHTSGIANVAFCSTRLLVPSTQAINLIGKQGSTIKSIQESSGASVRVLSADEVPSYVSSEERIVELQGEASKVVKALEAVVGHLRKFLVDHSVLPLFEKVHSQTAESQDRPMSGSSWADKPSSLTPQTGIGADFPHSFKREPLFFDRETHLEPRLSPPRLSAYTQVPALSSLRSFGLGHGGGGGPVVTQIAQTMKIPLSYAEDIIGTAGANIAFIRRTSGAMITVQETFNHPDEITVEINGTASEVHVAQQLIQEFISNHKESISSSYGKINSAGLRTSYGQLNSSTNYASSSLPSQTYGGSYGSSGVGGYGSGGSFRL